MLRVARRYSESAADADDAYQRALEKLLTRPPVLTDSADPLPWLMTVVRNEALMIVRSRSRMRSVPLDSVDNACEAVDVNPADRVVEREELDLGREALLRINPDQARCLLLRADGMSYEEIAAETGYTSAKVHRSLHHGRRVYRALLGRIESGAECRRLEPMISMHVDGELAEDDRRDVEMHLENCINCRAAMRDFALAPRDFAAAMPVSAALVERDPDFLARLSGHIQAASSWVNERVFGQLVGGPGPEMAFAKKLAVVTAVTATAISGGAMVGQLTGDETPGVVPPLKAAPPVFDPQPARTDSRDEPSKARRSQRRSGDRPVRPKTATEADVVGRQLSAPSSEPRARVREPDPSKSTIDSTEPLVDLPVDAERGQLDGEGVE